MKLRRLWREEWLEVIVRMGYYQFKGKIWPTLYSIVEEIAGVKAYPKQLRADGTRLKGTRKMSNWSAARFFKLYRLVGGHYGQGHPKGGSNSLLT
jgi:hypothetical protein